MEQLELDEIEYKTFCKVRPSLLSTTSTLSRIRGFSIIILECLKGGYLRSSEIYEITGKPCSYVNRYLYNLRKYGLIERVEDFWILTEKGTDFLEYYEYFIKNKNRIRKFNETLMKDNRKFNERCNRKKEDSLCADTSIKAFRRNSRQIQIEPFLRNSNLDDLEKAVVEVLITHYNKTGSKFIMVKDQYELAEKLNANPSDLPNALKNLRQDGIIYIFKDKTFNCWKIGLKKQFLERLGIKSEKI